MSTWLKSAVTPAPLATVFSSQLVAVPQVPLVAVEIHVSLETVFPLAVVATVTAAAPPPDRLTTV